jgi:hypothetical protein
VHPSNKGTPLVTGTRHRQALHRYWTLSRLKTSLIRPEIHSLGNTNSIGNKEKNIEHENGP